MAIRIGGFLLLFSAFFAFSVAISFSPADEYLVDCGSVVDSTVDNRRFIGDDSPSNVILFSSEGSIITLQSENPAPNLLPQIYKTARVFTRQAKYEFNVADKGTLMVRLHFHRFNSSRIDFSDAQFHVTVNGYVVLSNFSGHDDDDDDDSPASSGPRVREFLIWVDVGKVVIRFVPSKDSNFAFVNAIEVISAPKDLIADVATSVSNDGTEQFSGLVRQALEVVYRVNVGGKKVTPFNDTLWRTWVPDETFLKVADASQKVYFSGRIKYRLGGATREVGPDNVYNTARVVKSNSGSVSRVNMTWELPVSSGYKYLIRLHFCDIASMSIGMLYFNIYINGNLAYQDLDISDATNYVLASPYYIDFVVDDESSASSSSSSSSSGLISVSVGPSSKSVEHAVDAILNGIEIMKMNNTMGSLDGFVSTEMILNRCPNRRNLSLFMSMVAFMCILLSVYIVIQRRKAKDGFGWLRLSDNAPEDNNSKTADRVGSEFAVKL
ncbi:PREDICTED: probable receptor-like protein kinase At5g24010 [Camelina sativa]|uniref:Probable receptor-like protein kinase At5g24010 n=1 Tax=Camelina sativa TaxID=90675 RepID=A0ABM1QX39_CAMSA|nr:PREDICTED: probable receptor-like protein kinase At5g24010 [Camelina sativa]